MPDSLEWFSGNISSYCKSNIKIAHLNINSIQNKLDEVKEMLNRNMFDILFIVETKLDGMYSSSLLCQTVRSEKRCRWIKGVHTGGLVYLQATQIGAGVGRGNMFGCYGVYKVPFHCLCMLQIRSQQACRIYIFAEFCN